MIIFMLIVLGLCFGSFINALVWRLHEQSRPKKKRVASSQDLSIMTGRSMCTHCQHTLSALDLLPLFSWLLLGGKCRYCRQPIGWQYPLVEATTAILFIVSYHHWPLAFHGLGAAIFGIWLAAIVGLVALIVYDVRWMLLPNRIVFPLMALGAINVVLQAVFLHRPQLLMSGLISLAIAGGIFYLLFQFSDGKWIGGGDVKLGFALGLLLVNPSLSLLMLFLASLIGTVVSLGLMAVNRLKRTSQVPFGPFLIVATIISQLFGANIIDWYLHLTLIS